MRGDCSGVASGGGSGNAGGSFGEGPVEGGLQEGAGVQGGVGDARFGQDPHGLDGDSGDEVGAVGQARVVEGTVLLGDDDGFAAHFHDEGLGDRQEGGGCRDREGCAD